MQYQTKWCDVCKKMTNHETPECYYHFQNELESRKEQIGNERPRPILKSNHYYLETWESR